MRSGYSLNVYPKRSETPAIEWFRSPSRRTETRGLDIRDSGNSKPKVALPTWRRTYQFPTEGDGVRSQLKWWIFVPPTVCDVSDAPRVLLALTSVRIKECKGASAMFVLLKFNVFANRLHLIHNRKPRIHLTDIHLRSDSLTTCL